jgi:hypothetical protein
MELNMIPTQKPGVQFFGELPLSVPNTTYQGDGFYVSHNDRDVRTYGDVTTALVVGNGSGFYILNGDHRAGYAPLIPQGFDACMTYFQQHIDWKNKFSDTAPAINAVATVA